ncbi:MAG: hypothetical protein ACI870_000119 [Crocinitomicaceae bacterium]|jgi:hypothetical protein
MAKLEIKEQGTSKANYKTSNLNKPVSDYHEVESVKSCYLWTGEMDKVKKLPNGLFRRCYVIKTGYKRYINFTLLAKSKDSLKCLEKGERVKVSLQIIRKDTPGADNVTHSNVVIWGTLIPQLVKLTGSVKFTKNQLEGWGGYENPQGWYTNVKQF